jgi:hypothetical protein
MNDVGIRTATRECVLTVLGKIDVGGLNENARDRNRLCIEDPFETPYNVARTVTKDGLYTVSHISAKCESHSPRTCRFAVNSCEPPGYVG